MGCGTSFLAPSLLEDGFERVIGLDISEVLIAHLKHLYAKEDKIEWQVGDCRKMNFISKSFDVVFDKGTLDCLLCQGLLHESGRHALTEIARILKVGGFYVLISYGCAKTRSRVIQDGNFGFTLITSLRLGNREEGERVHNAYVFHKSKE
jgi:SAM-dependent methyltransferase